MFARIIVAAAVAAGCCAEAPGQNRGRRNQPQLERFEATGTIAGVGRG